MNENLLEKVDFGHDEAENDSNLVRYFLETDSFLRIFKGDKMYVIGRKGTGKSAIYLTIENVNLQEMLTSGLTFDDYSWQVHNKVRDLSKSIDFACVNTWKYIILLELGKLLIKESNFLEKTFHPDLKKVANFLEKNYGSLKPSYKDFLVDKFRRIKRLDLPSISSEGVKLGGIELEQNAPDEERLITEINIVNKELQEVIFKAMTNKYYFILFDKLDDGWDASNEFKSSMVGLLKAARDLNIESKKANKHLRAIVFLRSDIYDVLQYNDKNKAFQDIEFLRWDKEKLITLINKRIGFSLGLSDDKNAWNRIFVKEKMRSKTPNVSYLIKRTFLRPRDIISFCRECCDEARRNKRNIITNEDIYNAENLYSERVYREFLDEMCKQHPYVEKLFSVLRAMKTERFNFQMFQNEYNKKDLYPIENVIAQDALRILFEYNIVGIQKIGGKSGGSTFDFSYTDPAINMDLSKEIVIHPALKKHLRLVEKRTYEPVEPELGLYKKED